MQLTSYSDHPIIPLLTIVGMAIVTYATRAAGFWLMRYVTPSPRVEAWMRHLPGAVIVSIIAPFALTSGAPELMATVVAAAIAVRTHNLLLTIAVGAIAVSILRVVI